jgi:hypothetical protein
LMKTLTASALSWNMAITKFKAPSASATNPKKCE